tara:strand:+ start:487 stop:708 length:222 start_codon:yes stop_codon:yes gene_type:complete
MKILEADKIEIKVEKQSKEMSCNWCVYFSLEKRSKTKNLLMIKLKEKPILDFLKCNLNFVTSSNDVKDEFLKK